MKAGIKKGYSLKIDDEVVTLRERHVNFIETISERYSSTDFEYGTVCIDTMRSDEVLVQGYSREVVRRIQEMRKELDLDIEAFIEARVSVENERIIELLNSAEAKNYISRETRARKMEISRKIDAKGYEKKWSIDGEEFIISIQEFESPS